MKKKYRHYNAELGYGKRGQECGNGSGEGVLKTFTRYISRTGLEEEGTLKASTPISTENIDVKGVIRGAGEV